MFENFTFKKFAGGGGLAAVGYLLGQINTVKMDDRWLMIALGIVMITIGLFHYNGVLADLRVSRQEHLKLTNQLVQLVEKNSTAFTELSQLLKNRLPHDSDTQIMPRHHSHSPEI